MEMKGSWNIVKGRMKQHWAKLTDNDSQFVEGKITELVGRIQKRTGKYREDRNAEHQWQLSSKISTALPPRKTG
jgi:uncharacterized protein YjbJ (UPF0337 family)